MVIVACSLPLSPPFSILRFSTSLTFSIQSPILPLVPSLPFPSRPFPRADFHAGPTRDTHRTYRTRTGHAGPSQDLRRTRMIRARQARPSQEPHKTHRTSHDSRTTRRTLPRPTQDTQDIQETHMILRKLAGPLITQQSHPASSRT